MADSGFWVTRQPPWKVLLVYRAIAADLVWTLADGTRIDIVISAAGATGELLQWIGRGSSNLSFVELAAAECTNRKIPKVRRVRPAGDGDVKDLIEALI